jgi:hypothetical protein
MKKFIPIFIIIFVVGCAGSFFTGLKIGQNQKGGAGKASNFQNGSFSGNLANQERMKQMQARGMNDPRMMNRGGGAMTNGEITAKDDKSFTIKTANGSSKIVFYSSTTKASRIADIAVEDLSVGQSVWASGSPSQDGSLMANSIQLLDASQLEKQGSQIPPQEEKK